MEGDRQNDARIIGEVVSVLLRELVLEPERGLFTREINEHVDVKRVSVSGHEGRVEITVEVEGRLESHRGQAGETRIRLPLPLLPWVYEPRAVEGLVQNWLVELLEQLQSTSGDVLEWGARSDVDGEHDVSSSD